VSSEQIFVTDMALVLTEWTQCSAPGS